MEQKNLPTIVGYFNTSFSPMYKSCRQKLNREMPNLAEFIHLIDLINIYKNFHLNTEEYTFISAARRTFYKMNHILRHKENFKIWKKNKLYVVSYLTTTD